MNKIGMTMSDEDFTQLYKTFDKDGDRKIIYDEFLRALRPKMSLHRQHFVHLAFNSLDKDGSGEVDLAELAEIYKGGNVREFSQQWDDKTAPDGVITAEEFMNYYKDLSASVDTDEEFELMMRNAWHISGGEGASQNTSNIRASVTHSDGSQEVVEIIDDLGVSRKDMPEIRRRLEKQGVRNIESVSLAG
jgi:Ca2+-binding EF-hand superfamily protein